MHDDVRGLTRRAVIAGIAGTGVVAAAATTSALPAGALAAPGSSALAGHLGPQALDPATTGLTYLPVDAAAFFTGAGSGRYSDDTSGTGVLAPPATLLASLALPTGSVIRQLNVAYQGTPTLTVVGRPMLTPQSPTTPFTATLAAGGGPKTSSHAADLTVAANTTYSLRVLCGPGDSVYGVTVGYLPPAQGFVPFSGTTPRVYDSRTGAKLAAGEERTIGLGLAGVRGAVVNLTLTETEGDGGFVAVFPAGISWPGNSSANWFVPGQNVANSVITAVDAAGQIKVRGGGNVTHVVIDRVGWLI